MTIGYTGRYFDPTTGLQWNRGRWYDPNTGRWLSEDPIGFAGGQANLSAYVSNSPTNFVDADGLQRQANVDWHHLLPQKQAYRPKFARAFGGNGNVIHQPRFGWILPPQAHAAINRPWNQAWDEFFRNNPWPSAEQIEDQLADMMSDEDFAPYLKRGAPADCSYWQWNGKKPAVKTNHFRQLRRSMKFLGGVLAVGAAADTANAAFAPVYALGDEEARREYRTALFATRNKNFDAAQDALFGDYNGANPGVIIDNDPDGLFPKMLSRMVDANNCTFNAAGGTLGKAWEEWHERT